jgi:HD-GYP domain-containing protein (c-di-GMP phosphodiesterase class II)
VYDLRRGRRSRPLIGDLRAAELVAAEEAYLGARVRALMERPADKDTSTERHTGTLGDDEYAIVKLHPERGYELLSELGGFDESVSRLVLDHHERLDGSGYPRGVHADDLDLATRILAVCDVYDALVSKRVYRPAWAQDDALALLREESETAFDARCVEALERVVAPERVLV